MSHKAYSKERILGWIDKIRQYGMDSSFIKKEKTLNEMLKEIKELLERIEMFLKRVN